jgi:hypothetical protein
MPKDAHQVAQESREIDIWIVGEVRRETVIQYLASRGYRVIAQDDPETRRLFEIPEGPAADIVAEISEKRVLIAEVKGKDIDHALRQLRATAGAAAKKYAYIECKIFCKYPTPSTSEFGMPGNALGFRALRVFGTAYPSEWLLYENREKSSPELIRIGDVPVTIVFGPH